MRYTYLILLIFSIVAKAQVQKQDSLNYIQWKDMKGNPVYVRNDSLLQRFWGVENFLYKFNYQITGAQPIAHTHTENDINNLVNDLAGKASSVHTHTYASLTSIPATFTPSSHTHSESEITNLVSDLAAKQNTITNGSITNAQLAGSIDLTTKVTGILPFANGGRSGATAAPATTGTMTINMTGSIVTITPTGACTFNASGGVAGQMLTFSITTSGTTSFTLTWGTNFRKTGTLATGTTSARFFTVTFICLDGTVWTEIARTAAQS